MFKSIAFVQVGKVWTAHPILRCRALPQSSNIKSFELLMKEKFVVKSLIQISKLFAVLNSCCWGIYLKNLVSVFVLFHIVFSANDALGVQHSFAF